MLITIRFSKLGEYEVKECIVSDVESLFDIVTMLVDAKKKFEVVEGGWKISYHEFGNYRFAREFWCPLDVSFYKWIFGDL